MRYTIENDWDLVAHVRIPDFYRERIVGTVRLEVATLIDTRTGDTYPGGARRVTVKPSKGIAIPIKTKTYRGELAWNNAERHFDDAVQAFKYAASRELEAS